jgi:hypothetical protein
LELAFFMRLRTELEVLLRQAPRVLRFRGLRGCVKELTRTRRWCQRCQRLNDDIIEYLRQCLSEATQAGQCSLVIG